MSSEAAMSKKRPWGKIALVASLALNLLFIGAMAGASWLRHKPRTGKPPEFIIQRIVSDLPDAKKQIVTKLISGHFDEMRPKFRQVREQRKVLRDALKAEPFDSDKVLAAAGEISKLKRELDTAKADLLVKVLQPLNAKERQELLRSRFFRRMLGTGRKDRRNKRPPHHDR